MKPPTPSTTLEDYHRQLIQVCPFIDGRELPVTSLASTSPQSVQHGLGRAYRGAWVISGPDADVSFRVLSPNGRADVDKFVYFEQFSATAISFRLWIF